MKPVDDLMRPQTMMDDHLPAEGTSRFSPQFLTRKSLLRGELVVFVLFLTLQAFAYEKAVSFDGGTLRCVVDAAAVKTSDFIRIELEADVADGVKVEFPKAIKAKHLAMADHDLRPATMIDGRRFRAEATYVLEALLPGELLIPQQTVLIRDNGRKLKVQMPAIPIAVRSRLTDPKADILDIEPEVHPGREIAVVCLVIVLGLSVVLVASRLRRPEEKRTVVMESIGRLTSMRKSGQVDIAALRVVVQDCLGERLGVPGRSSSRDELRVLCARANLDVGTIAKVDRLLGALERSSYSRKGPGGEELLKLCEETLPDLETEVAAA